LKEDSLYVTKIVVNAYASVEGSANGNELLYQKRSEHILKEFQSLQDSTINLVVNAKENWNLFKRQLKGSVYSFLLDLDTAEQREFINKKKNSEALEHLLTNQRYGFIVVYTKPRITKENIHKFAFKEYLHLKNGKLNLKNINRLRKVFDYLLLESVEGRFDLNYLRYGNRLPNKKVFKKQHYALFVEELKNNISDLPINTVYTKLKKAYLKDKLNKDANYNLQAYLISNYYHFEALYGSRIYKMMPFNKIKEVIKEVKKREVDSLLQLNLEVFYHHALIKYEVKKGYKASKVKRSLDFLFYYYTENIENDAHRLYVAKFFAGFGQVDRCLDILNPLINKESPSTQAYIFYLKLYDQMQQAGLVTGSEEQLIMATNKLTKSEWCNLFIGPGNLRFQIFDHKKLKNEYCKLCQE